MRKRKILLDEVLIRLYTDGTIKIEGVDDSNQRANILKMLKQNKEARKKVK